MRPTRVSRRALLAGLLLPAALHSTTTAQVAAGRRALATQMAASSKDPVVSPLGAGESVRFGLTLPLRNVSGLQQLIREQQDPTSPQYHKYLSRQEFLDQFGPTEAEYAQLQSYAKSQGFTITRTFGNRMLLNVSGTAQQINKTFAVRMQHYKTATEGRPYYAPNVEPTVGAATNMLSVVGLSTRELPQPMLDKTHVVPLSTKVKTNATVRANAAVQAFTTGSGPDGQFLGSDMRAAYAGNVAAAGEGQSVGLVELGPYNLSDVSAYFNLIGQPLNVPIYNVYLDVDGVCGAGCDDGEEVIDMEQAISMAPNMSGLIIYTAYGSGSDALTAFAQAASDDIAKQLSLSFGFGGTPSTMPGYEQVFMELTAQGQNVFVASGDSGANVGDVGYPGNSPNITDVGGTDLVTNGPGGPWQSESAWVGSGGGWSTQSPIPSYQVPAINSANMGSKLYRNIPDVAMEANTDNIYCANGGCYEGIGGTSLAAPRWAGYLALANEQASGSPIGFLNPIVYALGQTSNYTTDFHDITTGNDFNSDSPNLFQAVPGYDLTTGWGTPNGQNMLDQLAPPSLASQPNFTLTASSATLNLTPGASASSAITLTGVNGFSGAVTLNAVVVGAPAGVTATLSSTSVTTSGQVTLSVDTSAATPGGTYLVAVNGTSGGLMHTVYIKLALPDYSLSAASNTLYLNQEATASDVLTVNPVNGFDSSVTLSLTGLPPLVTGTLSPAKTSSTSTLTLSAAVTAPTSPGLPVKVTGVSGGTSRTVPTLNVAISAATGYCGVGNVIDLSSRYNLTAIRTDGTAFSDSGLDGGGSAYSAQILTRDRVLNGVHFMIGAPDVPDALYAAGQSFNMPPGSYNAIQLLGTGIDGNQANQLVTVTYTDGTSQQVSLNFSDWYTPATNVDEGSAVAMPYRDSASGSKDNRQFNVYSYTLLLQPGKVAKSFTLPSNRAVVVLSATATNLPLGTEVNLQNAFNATGIYTDGTAFAGDGGLDGGGAAYSANLLKDTLPTGEDVAVGSSEFHLAAANLPNAVYGTGQTLTLPAGNYTTLKLLGTAVQGDQTDQPLTIQYADGTTQTVQQSFSDWSSLSGYNNESLAIQTPYRDLNDGTENQQNFNVYLYTLPLRNKVIKSITLPDNRNVVLLSITLAPASAVDSLPQGCKSAK